METAAVSGEAFLDVVAVRVVDRYELELTFSNAEIRVVDVEEDLWGPAFEPLRANYDLFAAVQVDEESGTIVWPNGADLSPERLHATSVPAPRA